MPSLDVTIPFYRMVNFHFTMVEIPFPDISSPKPQSVDLFWNQPGKNQRVEGEISIVQSIQLGFSRSLGSATLNDANKSAMRRAK